MIWATKKIPIKNFDFKILHAQDYFAHRVPISENLFRKYCISDQNFATLVLDGPEELGAQILVCGSYQITFHENI